MPPTDDKDLGNFIDALLTGLETLAGLEGVWTYCESERCNPDKKQALMYKEIEADLKEFQAKTGFTAAELLLKWNKAK